MDETVFQVPAPDPHGVVAFSVDRDGVRTSSSSQRHRHQAESSPASSAAAAAHSSSCRHKSEAWPKHRFKGMKESKRRTQSGDAGSISGFDRGESSRPRMEVTESMVASPR
ncbi:uncharacterized protein K452DRAFT_94922 [Aplosporella prunicola CBS 121167]|uniref:Uncharacterized protein n=1 Tax=Aplosporella prunicola CBS 121167 TaxID=1176127 RepID=A0A6A6B1K0_9PEZI|nr:uncharacterized protein K452DRAFT_94922 [Aplosporella prunicola CBS 121167]KAF2138092.1 hypothetical protein K452DRAFT_94922 [Aplosporella prunicola CBS 121167]